MSAYNKDELEPPQWMDSEFIFTVLKNCETEDPIEITEVTFTPGSEKGDHYGSVMFRAVAKFTTAKGSSTRSMIIKTLPELDSPKGALLAQTKIFETEIGMYSEIIPKFEAELKKYGDNTQLAAKVLYHSLAPRKVIVLEDLCVLGYNPIRGRFLNMVETKEMLLLLAKWHAVSFKLASQGDEAIKAYDQGLFNNPIPTTASFLSSGINNLAEVTLTLKGYEMYAEKVRAVGANLLKNCVNTFNAYKKGDTRSILVLNHGDFHMKNAMVKYSEEKLEDVLLVDFQLCTYAPAIIDVIYSIYMLMNPELRLSHREELTYFYFENFSDTLKKIEFNGAPPTLADFNIDLIRHRDFEIFVLANFLPMWFSLMEPAEPLEADQVIQSADHRATLYRHPKYIRELKEVLPKLLHKGYLNAEL